MAKMSALKSLVAVSFLLLSTLIDDLFFILPLDEELVHFP